MFATASGPLALRELTPAAGSSGPALNTALEVGCWAFDGVQVIAASQLFPVDPGDLTAGAFPIVAACTAGADGKSCQLAEPSGFRTFGTSVGGECRHRCFESTDCQRAQLREQQRAAQVADASADAEAPDGGTADASTTGGHCSSADMTRTVVGTCEGP